MDFKKIIAGAIASTVVYGIAMLVVYFFVKFTKEENGNKEKIPVLAENDIPEYKGLRGGLIVLGLLLFFKTMGFGYNIGVAVHNLKEYKNNLLAFDLLSNVLFLFLSSYVIYLFFSRSKVFPKYCILLQSLVLIMYLSIFSIYYLGWFASFELPKNFSEEAGVVFIYTVFWIKYIIDSKRVKATFIE